MEVDDYHFKFKIAILGDKHVGKSTLTDSFTSNFGKLVESETSDELSLKIVGYMNDNVLYQIQYWEIPGYLKNMLYFYKYCLGATAAIYMFDCSKKSSLDRIDHWIVETEKCNIPIKVLVGNKVDLMGTSKNNISKQDAITVARKYNMEYFEVSSIGDSSVAIVFDYIFTTILNSIPNPPKPELLVGKGIILGKRLLNSTSFQQKLCDLAALYE